MVELHQPPLEPRHQRIELLARQRPFHPRIGHRIARHREIRARIEELIVSDPALEQDRAARARLGIGQRPVGQKLIRRGDIAGGTGDGHGLWEKGIRLDTRALAK